jgi:chromosome segregation ATPase
MTAPPAIANPKVKGCLGVALEIISFDAKYYTAISNMLGRILIFENLDSAVEFTKKSRSFNRIVTLDGEIVRSSGALTGGGEARKSGGYFEKTRTRKLKKNSQDREKEKKWHHAKTDERSQILNVSTREKTNSQTQSAVFGFFRKNKEKQR